MTSKPTLPPITDPKTGTTRSRFFKNIAACDLKEEALPSEIKVDAAGNTAAQNGFFTTEIKLPFGHLVIGEGIGGRETMEDTWGVAGNARFHVFNINDGHGRTSWPSMKYHGFEAASAVRDNFPRYILDRLKGLPDDFADSDMSVLLRDAFVHFDQCLLGRSSSGSMNKLKEPGGSTSVLIVLIKRADSIGDVKEGLVYRAFAASIGDSTAIIVGRPVETDGVTKNHVRLLTVQHHPSLDYERDRYERQLECWYEGGRMFNEHGNHAMTRAFGNIRYKGNGNPYSSPMIAVPDVVAFEIPSKSRLVLFSDGYNEHITQTQAMQQIMGWTIGAPADNIAMVETMIKRSQGKFGGTDNHVMMSIDFANGTGYRATPPDPVQTFKISHYDSTRTDVFKFAKSRGFPDADGDNYQAAMKEDDMGQIRGVRRESSHTRLDINIWPSASKREEPRGDSWIDVI